MNKILTIMKKELKRFFSDKRMLMTLIMPGIIIFVIYSLMGTFMGDAFNPDTDYNYKVIATNLPDEYKPIFETESFNISLVSDTLKEDEIKQKIKDKDLDLYVTFEEDFNNKVENNLQPKVSIFYNASSTESGVLYNYVYQAITMMGTDVDYKFLVNMDPNLKYDLATNEDISVKMLTMMVPYILLIFLFSGSLAVTTESIAGEKERGTINTLLVTPTKRRDIAIGKISALSLTSLVSGVVSFAGLILSFPILLSSSGGPEVTLKMYGVGTILAMLLVIFLTEIMFTTILSIISTMAKNVKEANQWASVVMIIVMLLGITSLIGGGYIQSNPIYYLLPIYNNVQCMMGVLALEFNVTNFIITVIANVVYITLGVILLAKMFNSEKIMSSN